MMSGKKGAGVWKGCAWWGVSGTVSVELLKEGLYSAWVSGVANPFKFVEGNASALIFFLHF